MKKPFQIRTDLMFQFENSDLGDTYLSYHLNDFIVRVEKVVGGGDGEVRYGVMLDFENDDAVFKKSYILEIPASSRSQEARKKEQESVIVEYINQMRERFSGFYASAMKAGTVDEFDKAKRSIASADGKWNIVRQFRKQRLSKFLDWIVNKDIGSRQDAEEYLVRNRMAFETNQEYIVSVDWAVPYICYKDSHKVSHFDGGYGNGSLFYPFHNFAWQDQEICTKIRVEPDVEYAKVYSRGVQIKPTNYSLFAFYSHVIDEIYFLQNENFEAIKPYFIYVQNLNVIRSLLTEYGPLAKLSEKEIENLDLKNSKGWSGDTSDEWWGDNATDFARGLADIAEAVEFFNGVIIQESKTGRNAGRSVQIESLAYSLRNAFLNNEFARENYCSLWAFNKDIFGVDLFVDVMFSIFSKMSYANEIYSEYLVEGLYEHPVLDEAVKSGCRPSIDPAEWGNIFYRADNVAFNIWMGFYPIREGYLKSLQEFNFRTKVVPTTPHSGHIEKWIIENAISNKPLLGTQYPVGTNSAPQDYTAWKLSDEQVRKLANYLLGGGQIENLKSIEAELSRTIKNLLGTVDFKEVPFDKINQLHEKLLNLKKGLMEKIPEARIDGVQHGLNFSAAGINLLLAKVTYDNAYSAGAGIEAKLRAHSLAVGVFSDVANTIAKFKGVEATLVRTMAHKAGGRLAMSLGALQFVGGGVGGRFGWTLVFV